MTDNTVVPDSLPEPRPSSDRIAEREVALRALAGQTAPGKPPGAAGMLTDRILLHTSWRTGQHLLPLLPSNVGGLIFRGSGAATAIKHLRKTRFDRPILIDPEGYTQAAATEDTPFVLTPDDDGGMFGLTLEQELQRQRDCDADVILTPTGYLHAGDSDALRAAVSIAAQLGRDDVMFSAPLDVGWFIDEHIEHLIAVLAGLAMPKAVFLGGQFDPLQRYKAAVVNLRRLLAEVGNVAVFRTDLTGFDAMSHGAFATSIGSGGSLRHTIPFGQFARANKDDKSPSVLFGDLMSFHKGSTLHTRFADAIRPPVCDCPACGGRALTTFLERADSNPAHQHSMCTWASWIDDLLNQPTLADRATWWRNRCAGAITHTDVVNVRINQPDGFTPPDTLRAWAELPAWLSATQPTTKRSRTR